MRSPDLISPMAWRRSLEPHEPAVGYAARLASLNGRALGRFLRDKALSPRDLDLGTDEVVDAIAILGGCDRPALRRCTPKRRPDGHFTIAGHLLDRRSILRTGFRFCPRCLTEDVDRFDGPVASRPYLRIEWLIDHGRICNNHGLLLVDAYPIRRRFEPFDTNETLAPLLPQLEQLRSLATPMPRSDYQSWMIGRIDGEKDAATWLDGLDLAVGIAFCEALGVSALHEPKVRTSTLSMADWARAADEGYRIASAGENGIRELLERLNRAQESTRGYWGLRDTYGYVYGLLQKTVDNPAYEQPRRVVREFALATVPIEPGTDVLGEAATGRRLHTIRSAAIASGAHARTVRRLFARRGLAPDEESGVTDHRVVVEAAELETTLAALRNAVSTPKAIAMTGIPRLHFFKLVARGWLPTVTGTNRVADAKHRFAPEALRAFMDRLFAGAEEVDAPENRRMGIVDARRASIASIEALLEMILEGRLAWKGRLRARSDYGALLVDADEVTRLVRSEGPRTNLTKKEVLDHVPGMGAKSVQAFIDAGMLQTCEEFSSDARRVIKAVTRESADAFVRNYVTLGELCRGWGMHHQQVLNLLKEMRVTPCVDPKLFGTYVFERQRVAPSPAQDSNHSV